MSSDKKRPAKNVTDQTLDSRIRYRVECLPEHIPIEGNVLASGDSAEDKRAEQYVYDELNRGNEWAWCTVKVTAHIPGIDLEGTAFLGCCSYQSETDFCFPGGYYDDMQADARAELLQRINEVKALAKEIS